MRAKTKLEQAYIDYIEDECMTGDYEADHGKADDALIEYLRALGHGALADAWEKVRKWYA
jgi:hypothetical protein